MRRIFILGLLVVAFMMCAGFTACGGAYYGRNIGVGGYMEQPAYYPVYPPVYSSGYGYGFPGPICGWNSSGLPLGCNAGPVAPSYLRDIGVLPRPYPFYPYRGW